MPPRLPSAAISHSSFVLVNHAACNTPCRPQAERDFRLHLGRCNWLGELGLLGLQVHRCGWCMLVYIRQRRLLVAAATSLALTRSACCACSQPAAHDMHAVLLSLIIAMHSDHSSSHFSICPCSVHRLDRGGGPRSGGRQPGGGGSHHSAGAGALHPALLPPALRPRRLPPAQVDRVPPVVASWMVPVLAVLLLLPPLCASAA